MKLRILDESYSYLFDEAAFTLPGVQPQEVDNERLIDDSTVPLRQKQQAMTRYLKDMYGEKYRLLEPAETVIKHNLEQEGTKQFEKGLKVYLDNYLQAVSTPLGLKTTAIIADLISENNPYIKDAIKRKRSVLYKPSLYRESDEDNSYKVKVFAFLNSSDNKSAYLNDGFEEKVLLDSRNKVRTAAEIEKILQDNQKSRPSTKNKQEDDVFENAVDAIKQLNGNSSIDERRLLRLYKAGMSEEDLIRAYYKEQGK